MNSDFLQEYKDAMSKWSSGVTIVTTNYNDEDCGMTVSSFTSVSLEPPLISVCIQSAYRSCEAIKNSGCFAVNILTDNHQALGNAFADHDLTMSKRFDKASWHKEKSGSLILDDGLAFFDCEVADTHVFGDHTTFIGKVLKSGHNDKKPILYHNRKWVSL